MDFAVALALVSLIGTTFLANLLARRRERSLLIDPLTHEARQLLLIERASPVPLCPTLREEHWARIEAAQPAWRRQIFALARERYLEARAAFRRNEIDGEPYYPDPSLIAGAAHQVLVLTERL